VESFVLLLGDAGLANLQTGLDQFDVAIAEGIINNPLILLNRDRASRVYNIPACFRLGIDAVNGGENQFLLEVG